MKTILVPFDFSESSMNGVEAAAILARNAGARLHMLNVVYKADYFVSGEPMFYTLPSTYLLQEQDEKLEEVALKNLHRTGKRNMFKKLEVIFQVKSSAVIHEEIIRYGSQINADLVVIGSKGASGLKNILLGSTAERVVRFSERPVLVVPAKLKGKKMKSIVFASDFHEEAYGIFPFVKKFAGVLGAEIHLLKINTIEQFNSTGDNTKLMSDFNKHFKSKYRINIYDDFMKEEGIMHFAGKVNADLIAIGTHGKKGLVRFFRPDISGGMVRLSQKPILVVNIKKFKSKSDVR